ncbi:MAG TPA: phenylalanine--tRNA ligase subunit alpha [Acidimicrobiia bacterium]|nr:phenylalanine--tRNA ligase subunit alpha [Acidimicrobiia bacterium]
MNLSELTALLDAELARAKGEIDKVEAAADLADLERAFLGKRSAVTTVNQSIKDLEPAERPKVGQAVSAFKSAITDLVEGRRAVLGDGAGEAVDRLDLTLPGRGLGRGHLHLITQVQQELEEVFLGLGYEVAEGPEVETDFYNFEALNMPPAHPARSMWDTLYVKLGRPEEVVLRTHTSPVQIRVMESRQPPVYTVMPGRCYRRDTLDARHSPVFHQIEGLVVDRGITFGDLAGTIDAFTRAYFGPGHTSRLRPSYFPFTEPSAEFEVTCFVCDGAGCSVCSKTGWLELGGCGMVDPNVFRAVGYDSEIYTGFAFGFGLERMAMVRYGVEHIKSFFENDIRFLKQF